MEASKQALIHRNLVFWLGGGKITDPDKVLAQIALDTDSTTAEVWEVYGLMLQATLYKYEE